MPKALAISSHVAYGPVGNSAAVPAMQALGLTVHAVPTIVLSNHPGHGRPAGLRVPARDLAAMTDALEALGVLDACAGVMTGYFATAGQIHCIARSIRNLKGRKPSIFYLCDPVLGDDHTGLYVPEPVALAIRDLLLPLAAAVTPNRFELEWLSGRAVAGSDDAVSAARKLAVPSLIATSIPGRKDHLLTMLIEPGGSTQVETVRRPSVPHGTGDLLSGLYLAHKLLGSDNTAALRTSVAAVEQLIDASTAGNVLNLAALASLQSRCS